MRESHPKHRRTGAGERLYRDGSGLFGALFVLVIAALPPPALAEPGPPSAEAPPAEPQSSPFHKLVDELSRSVSALGGKLGLSISDVGSGRTLAEVNAKLPVNPASNMKLLTAVVVLDRLGPSYRFATGLYGKRQGDQVPQLVIRGHGDPSGCSDYNRDM